MSIGQSHRTLREVVADEVRRMIMSGDLKPGERLYEDRLAEQLGVSRNPVREAIRALEGTGLVEVIPRRGAYVSQFDPDETRQLLELRCVIEAYAAEQAALLRTDDDIEQLRACLVEGRAASEEGDVVRAAEWHRGFHVAIEKAARNVYLDATVGPLRHQTELVFSMLQDTRAVLGWDEHQAIFDAIAAGDTSAARARTVDHMDSVVRDLHDRSAASGR